MADLLHLLLSRARVAVAPGSASLLDVEIRGGRIHDLRPPSGAGLDLSGHIILPGLVNAHDHLEYSLYPRLGRGPYANAGEWARDIYHPERSPVCEQRAIPKCTRLIWGGLKSVLSGVTTVCHHNPAHFSVFERGFLVRVTRQFGWAHSLEFSPDLVERFRKTPPEWPFVVHLGEAVDEGGRSEIYRLDAMGALDERTVLVHAVALDRAGLLLARQRGASLVWCPSSNLFVLGRTLSAESLRLGLPVALGSDSTATADGDLLDELIAARRASGLQAVELYHMVTDVAARILRLSDGQGLILTSGRADLAVFRDTGDTPAQTLLRAARTGPELVIAGGRVKLVREELARRLPALARRGFSGLRLDGRGDFLLPVDVPRLYRQAVQHLGAPVRLAGRTVSIPAADKGR